MRSKRTRHFATVNSLVALSVVFSGASASAESYAEYMAQSFVGFCVQNAGRNDKVSAAARVLGFKELEGDLKMMIAPQNPKTEYSGWLVTEKPDQPFLLGISADEMKSVPYSNCVIASPRVSVDEVLEEIRKLTPFGAALENIEEAGQRYRVWVTEGIAERSIISAVDAPKMGITGGTISLSAPTEN